MNIQLGKIYKLRYSPDPMWLFYRELETDQHKLDYVTCRWRNASVFAILPLEWRDSFSGGVVYYRAGLDNITSGKMAGWIQDRHVRFYFDNDIRLMKMVIMNPFFQPSIEINLENCT